MARKPYALTSDQHLHNWSAFATINGDGINSRLAIILSEMRRAASEIHALGGTRLLGAGDLFHVRGNVAPSVLNPAADHFATFGLDLEFIPGNHDLEGRSSTAIGNAARTLSGVGVRTHETPTYLPDANREQGVLMIPWVENLEKLRETIEEAKSIVGGLLIDTDLIIHAPVNGVLVGLPDSGLNPTELAALGFKRVFAGHYHNHMDFGNGVYSIGATTHQTWSDVDTKAGFLIVHEDRVEYRASHAPQFIDLPEGIDLEEVAMIVDGHYVRARIEVKDESIVPELRDYLLKAGAKGVVIHPIKSTATVSRTGATVSSGVSLEASINEWIKVKNGAEDTALFDRCAAVLSKAKERAA